MAAQRKLRISAKGAGALTRLKQLPPETRAELMALTDTMTAADWRAHVRRLHAVSLSSDSAVTKWRQWQFRQAIWDHLNDMSEQDEAALKDKFPTLSREQIREAAIKRSYAIADQLGDAKLSLAVVATDLKAESVDVDKRKLVLLEKKAAQAEQAETITRNEDLTPEQKAAQMRAIFGMD